jgi:hypothetical protein
MRWGSREHLTRLAEHRDRMQKAYVDRVVVVLLEARAGGHDPDAIAGVAALRAEALAQERDRRARS